MNQPKNIQLKSQIREIILLTRVEIRICDCTVIPNVILDKDET